MSRQDLEDLNDFSDRLLSITENRVTPNPLHHTMPQDFLERLLSTIENRVRSKQGSSCMICLEDYNTMNTSTGVVEWEIRLPCGHGVGSSCIVAWLHTSNSCPTCRATFFAQQPRPNLEDDNMGAGRASMGIVRAFAITFVLTFVAAALIVAKNMFNETNILEFKLTGWTDLSSNSPSGGPSSKGPAIQAWRCMDWQDCSFLSSRSR